MRSTIVQFLEHRDGHLKRPTAKHFRCLIASLLLSVLATATVAHVSERALVLLLPTDIYIRSGVIAVALTVALLFLLPPSLFRAMFRANPVVTLPSLNLARWTSLISTVALGLAIYAGFEGSRDPLANPLPLLIWTIWWIALPVLSALFGNIWRALNPWSGLYKLLRLKPLVQRPAPRWPALILMILFVLFTVSDIAPDDPDRLAAVVLGYWVFTFAAMILFGTSWLDRAEPFSVYFAQLAKLAPMWREPHVKIGFPGTRLITGTPPLTLALLIVIALGAGSFDGLNETFWWLAQIGINPLEFPGRSAVTLPNAIGALGGIATLGLVFGATVYLGLVLVRAGAQFKALFPRLVMSLLPIALGYHIAHYLTSFMVGGQYAAKAATDPMGNGLDLLNLGQFYVTTSFFNVPETVETIWLTQASAIVIGHILAVLIAHGIALDALGSHRKATLSQLPVAAFMVAYTFFGLWILAQPTGA